MPRYKYKIIKKDGSVEQNEVEADSVDILRKEIELNGGFVEIIKEIKEYQWPILRKKMVTNREFFLFVHEFIALLKAGVTLPEILHHIANRPSQPYFSRVLFEIRKRVVNGQALSSGMAEYPRIFDKMFINAVSIGEKNGQLRNSLAGYLSYLKLKIEIQQKVRAAFVYPAFLSLMLVSAVAVLFFFVLPRFTSMYAEFGAELPYPTRILMVLVDNSHIIIPMLLVLAFAITAFFKHWLNNRKGRVIFDKFILSVPWIREITIPFNISRNTSALAALLSVGVPLVKALRAVSSSCDNAYIAERLETASKQMSEGKGLSETIKGLEIMDDAALTMIRAGEKSGDLIEVLKEISSFNADKMNQAISRHLSLIEPMMMLLIGLIVGGIIFVMYLPIFTIAEVIR